MSDYDKKGPITDDDAVPTVSVQDAQISEEGLALINDPHR
jgi:hypothetical protein